MPGVVVPLPWLRIYVKDKGDHLVAIRRPAWMGNVQVGEREIGLTNPPVLLRLEGLVGLIVAVLLYREGGGAELDLVRGPVLRADLSMAGYAAGNRVGAVAYNAAHTLVLPLILGAFGVLGDTGVGPRGLR